MKYYIVWYHEGNEEDYTIIYASDLDSAKAKAHLIFGPDVISVEEYKP